MADYMNRPILWNTQRGTVSGQTEKRGKVLLSVKLDDGRDVKIELGSVEFADQERFTQPDPDALRTWKKDYYGDQRRMFGR